MECNSVELITDAAVAISGIVAACTLLCTFMTSLGGNPNKE